MLSFIALSGCALVEAVIPKVPVDVPLASHASTDPNDPVRAWDVEVAIDAETPTFVSRPANADVGPTLLIDSLAREDGVAELVRLSVEDLAATGEPFVLNVSLGGEGTMSVEPGARAPVAPPECAINIDPATLDAQSHAADLLACFRAWVDLNGVPAKPTVSFTLSPSP